MSVMTIRHMRLAGAFMLLAGLTACTGMLGGDGISVTRTGESNNAPPVNAVSEPDDVVAGRREHPRIIAAYGGVYSDRKAEVMLARMAGRLLEAAGQEETDLTVTILDSPDVNAFALPGGYIYVTRGILALANDASELSAVVAHELAHVILRHARARSNRTRTSEIVDRVITGVLGGDLSTDQSAARSRLSLAAFSQAQELAADEEGVRISGQAGYDPHSAARFLGGMGRFAGFVAGSEMQDDFLSSHPSTPDRIEKALAAAEAFGEQGPREHGRDDYLSAIDGMTFGDSPNQGAVVGQQFIHPVLKFTFTVPKRFTLENTQSAVVGIAGDGEAVRFDTATVPESMTLTDYMKSGWVSGLKQDTVRATTSNGIEMAQAEARTEQWEFRIAVTRLDGEVYRFIFAAKSADDSFLKAVSEVVGSFRRTQASDIARIQTLVIRVVEAKAGDTTSSMAARMADINRAGDLFLILNNLYAGDPLTPGRKYKIVSVE